MLLLLLYLGSVLGQAQIPNVFWCPCLIISFDVGVSAGEVLEGYMGFEKFCPAESYIRYENAPFALPRPYKVYAKIKRNCKGERSVLVNIDVEVDDEPSDYYV